LIESSCWACFWFSSWFE